MRFSYDDQGNVVDHDPTRQFEVGKKCPICRREHSSITFEEERDEAQKASAWYGRVTGVIAGLALLYQLSRIFW